MRACDVFLSGARALLRAWGEGQQFDLLKGGKRTKANFDALNVCERAKHREGHCKGGSTTGGREEAAAAWRTLGAEP
jgi:hypothetical protein